MARDEVQGATAKCDKDTQIVDPAPTDGSASEAVASLWPPCPSLAPLCHALAAWDAVAARPRARPVRPSPTSLRDTAEPVISVASTERGTNANKPDRECAIPAVDAALDEALGALGVHLGPSQVIPPTPHTCTSVIISTAAANGTPRLVPSPHRLPEGPDGTHAPSRDDTSVAAALSALVAVLPLPFAATLVRARVGPVLFGTLLRLRPSGQGDRGGGGGGNGNGDEHEIGGVHFCGGTCRAASSRTDGGGLVGGADMLNRLLAWRPAFMQMLGIAAHALGVGNSSCNGGSGSRDGGGSQGSPISLHGSSITSASGADEARPALPQKHTRSGSRPERGRVGSRDDSWASTDGVAACEALALAADAEAFVRGLQADPLRVALECNGCVWTDWRLLAAMLEVRQ